MASPKISSDEGASRCFAFIFPMASGHINPSLPVARMLVQQGHRVHYLCREQMREAIEDTGAQFHLETEVLTELYEGREPFFWGALPDLQKELGMEDEGMVKGMMKVREIQLEMMMPGAIRWLKKTQAHAVVCCPLMNQEAVYAAKVLGIPCAGILTTAGPGSMALATTEFLATAGMTPESCLEERLQFQPMKDCIQRLKADYGIELFIEDGFRPLGKMSTLVDSALTIVTTGSCLQDPMSPELEQAYRDANVSEKIVFVGPLLDKEGARRAAGHKFRDHDASEAKQVGRTPQEADPLLLLRAAKAAGRQVIYASMGTVITGDSPDFGWTGRLEVNGKPGGLSGKELCQAAWGAAFDAFGSQLAEEGPLLLVSLGPQADALDENLLAPANACCLPAMPQVDLLKAGVDLFLTHGGQNSFMEGLSTATPMVVCPGFGDQPVNARKVAALGVGLQVERPMTALEEAAAAGAAYRQATASALEEVLRTPAFKTECERCAESLRAAGGVPRAVELLLDLAKSGATAAAEEGTLPKLLGQSSLAATKGVEPEKGLLCSLPETLPDTYIPNAS